MRRDLKALKRLRCQDATIALDKLIEELREGVIYEAAGVDVREALASFPT